MLLVDIFFRSLKPKAKMPFNPKDHPPLPLSPGGFQCLPLSKIRYKIGHAPANQLEIVANQGVTRHPLPIYTTLIYVSLSHLKQSLQKRAKCKQHFPKTLSQKTSKGSIKGKKMVSVQKGGLKRTAE